MTDITDTIRNFAIIAHIDHGKSTISDRIIELCNGLTQRKMKAQVLDSMDIERERGITIKAQTINLQYTLDGVLYSLNLIDTPGHVDFSYEVSRCLSACEGVLLIVDATQGIEAQTLANAYQAVEENLSIIPVLNKIDLPAADAAGVKKQISNVIGISTHNSVEVSGKTGVGIPNLMEEIIYSIPSPTTSTNLPLSVLLVDASYDQYIGVVMLVRVINGTLRKGDKIKMLSNNTTYSIEDLGVYQIKRVSKDRLRTGEIGFVSANIKNVSDCKIGDTLVAEPDTTTKPIKGFQVVRPSVFCGLYPVDNEDYESLKQAIAKLILNDPSVSYDYESSVALGSGFRCGFLGMLHIEIFCERLEREFNIPIITSVPSVLFKVTYNNNSMKELHSPSEFPDPTHIKIIQEPIAKVNIITPQEYIGAVMNICIEKRGVQTDTTIADSGRVVISYDVPMLEIITDFHDKIKAHSKGYASFEWEMKEYHDSDIVKVDIMINGESVDALSLLVHRSSAERKGRAVCKKLRELIPRQMFAVPLQAVIGGKIIARETISPMRKDVTAKCYGGDISRKRKLIEKQKKGKKKMKMLGSVEVPQSAFAAALSTDTD